MSLRPSERAQRRRGDFKPSVTAEDGLRRRLGDMVGLRKDSRDRCLQRRRIVGTDAEAAAQPPVSALQKKVRAWLARCGWGFCRFDPLVLGGLHSVIFTRLVA